MESHQEGSFETDPATLAALLDEAFLAAWYGTDAGPEAAARVASLYAEMVEGGPEFLDAFLRDEVRVRSNFSLLPAATRPWPR